MRQPGGEGCLLTTISRCIFKYMSGSRLTLTFKNNLFRYIYLDFYKLTRQGFKDTIQKVKEKLKVKNNKK